MPGQENRQESVLRCRGRLTAVINLSLCAVGSVFIVIGVLRSTLLLYVGCAFIGAAIGGFIRSRLPVHNMVPLHMMYRSDLQRMHAFNDGTQTFVLLRPTGISQSVINANTTVKSFTPSFNMQGSDGKDDISVVSSLFEVDEFMCIICLGSFVANQNVRQLHCGHFYHVACIDRWLRINEVCPTCRIPVTKQLQAAKKDLSVSVNYQLESGGGVAADAGSREETETVADSITNAPLSAEAGTSSSSDRNGLQPHTVVVQVD